MQSYTFTFRFSFEPGRRVGQIFIICWQLFGCYLQPTSVIYREIGICVLETINPGWGKKAFILSIELCQKWDNRFYLEMTDMRHKGVENTSKIQPIKSDSLKENKGDLSLTDISWTMKTV